MTQPEWLRAYAAGCEGGEQWESVEETQHFALVRIPGRHYHSGQGRPFRYAPQEYQIVRKDARHDRDPERRLVRRSGKLNKEQRSHAIFSLKFQEWSYQEATA